MTRIIEPTGVPMLLTQSLNASPSVQVCIYYLTPPKNDPSA